MMGKPKIRFKGYNEDWEQRKFAELAEYKKGPFGSAITKSMFVPKSDDSVKVYEQQNAINKDWSLERYFLPKEYAYTRLKAFEVHSGDIIVSCAGTIGEIYEIPDNAEYGVINQALMRVRVYEKIVDKRMFIIAFSNMINEFTRTHSNGSAIKNIPPFADLKPMKVLMPSMEEQRVISECFEKIDYLITLHQHKCDETKKLKKCMLQKMFPKNGKKVPEIRFDGFANDWEQRKLGEICSRVQGNDGRMELPTLTISAANGWMKQEDRFSGNIAGKEQKNYTLLHKGELSYNHGNSKLAKYGTVFSLQTYEEALVPRVYHSFKVEIGSADFIEYYFATKMPDRELRKLISSGARMDGLLNIGYDDFMGIKMMFPSVLEQDKIAECFRAFDHLITLHHHEEFCTENVLIYIEINITIQIKEDIMAELESVIEQKLIDQLVYGDSQWTYRADLKTEEDLWNNFRYILEQNNKDRLNGEPLSDTEFEQVKNQLQFSSFYKAGEWLVGENGKVMVHVQRDTERLHLVVMNHEHIAGGSSVYEVINQYRALADEESQTKAQDRRFDVTLMINGLPMIHIELKNKQHSYMDVYWRGKVYRHFFSGADVCN